MSKQKAMTAIKKFYLILDGPHKSIHYGWVGNLDAPPGQSFNGQYRSICVDGLNAKEFWTNVFEMAELDGPELCDDEREEI